MLSIAVAGHICVDIRPELTGQTGFDPGRLVAVGPVAMTLGGSVGNTGLGLAALGADVSLFTSVGDDDLGRFVQLELAEVPARRVVAQVLTGASTSYSLILEPSGVDRTIWHNVGANAGFTGAGIDFAGVGVFHLGYPPLLPALLMEDGEPLRRLLASARARGATTSVDLAVVDPASPTGSFDWPAIVKNMAAQCDVLSPSLDDLTSALAVDEPYSAGLVERLAALLISWGAAVVAISAGPHGLFLRTAGEDRLVLAGRALEPHAREWADRAIRIPAITVADPVTTNGAGDASSAGLVFGLARGIGPKASAALAAACAAVVVSGSRPDAEAVAALRPDLASVFDDITTGAGPALHRE
jgi:sugar/nucleoside kinase (ribokinase family)